MAAPGCPPDPSEGADVPFRVLGLLEVRRQDGVVVDLAGGRQRSLLARLLVAEGRPVGVDDLVDAVYGDDPPPSARASLQSHVSRLRGTLSGTGGVVRSASGGYALDVPRADVDARRFEADLGHARGTRDAVERAGILTQALEEWRGPALAEFPDDFARPAAARWDELRTTAAEERAAALLAADDAELAVAELEAIVARNPLRENAYALLMRALYQRGRHAEALAAYGRLRERLRDDVGLEPSPALRRLQAEVLDQAVEVVSPRPIERVPVARTGAPTGPPTSGRQPLPGLPPTRLVGREQDLEALRTRLGGDGVLTLVGPGGVGKTRLALHVAHLLATDLPGGAVWVPLAPLRRPGPIAYAVAEALGLCDLDAADPVATLPRGIGSRRTLVVLDNCEHLLDEVAAVVARLAAATPAVLLLTSREPVGVPGEELFRLDPLASAHPADVGTASPAQGSDPIEGPGGLPPAVRLLADRVAAVRGRPLTDDELPDAVRLAERLDGLPLALELAAPRAVALGLPLLADRAGLDLLDRGPRAGEARHDGLRSVLTWSYTLLSDSERHLFDRLSVFPGTFSLPRAEAICSDERVPARRVPALLADLVDRSLVTTSPGPGRYRLLTPLREYAAERLAESGETERWGRRHAGHLADVVGRLAERLDSPVEAQAVLDLVTDLDDLRAAHAAAAGAGDLDTVLRLADGVHLLASRQVRPELFARADEAARADGASGHPLYPAVLASAAKGSWLAGDFAGAVRRAHTALEAAPDVQDPRRLRGLLALAEVDLVSRRLPTSIARYRDAVDLAVRSGRTGTAVDAAGGLAMALADAGQVDEGLEAARRCEELAEDTGAPSQLAWARYARARCVAGRDPSSAARLLADAAHLAAAVDNRSTQLSALTRGLALPTGAAPADRLPGYGEALRRWSRSGTSTFLWVTLRDLATLLSTLGREEPAGRLRSAAERALAGGGTSAARLDAALALAAQETGSGDG